MIKPLVIMILAVAIVLGGIFGWQAFVGSSLGSFLGGGYVNYFSMQTRSYKVIPQVERVSRLNATPLLDYPIANIGGVPVPLSTVARIRTETVPETLNHFQQLNSATLSGVAALYESFRDPLVILISVPLSIVGALIFVAIGVGGATLNIYTQVGLVTLIGLISKHGILIVEVANEEQKSGKSKRAAIVKAASVRLRPIWMTTAAMVLGVIPLVLARGAGARIPRCDRARDLQRPWDWHAVHAICRPCGLYDDRRHGLPRERPTTARVIYELSLTFNKLRYLPNVIAILSSL